MSEPCAGCGAGREASLVKLGVRLDRWDYLIALAGNPNTGKSTVFNALTGLRQHTGNWPGKTVARAEGGFDLAGKRVKVIDLPGTYSLQAGSADEEVARDFILFGRPDVTVVVVDATRLERNLNLVLQILEITDKVVVCLNLVDEAKRHGVGIDVPRLGKELGVPVVPAVARRGSGIPELLDAIQSVASGDTETAPFRARHLPAEVEAAVAALVEPIRAAYPDVPNSRWVALRLLNADTRVEAAVLSGDLGSVTESGRPPAPVPAGGPSTAVNGRRRIIDRAQALRWKLSPAFHDSVAESNYEAAQRIASRCQLQGLRRARFDFDRTLDRMLTSRWLGFPLMLLVLTVVLWLTIAGANVPSQMLAGVLLDTVHPALKGIAAGSGVPWWLDGLLIDGVYRATAWVVSVMLPPMAIFFPLFTLLEDFGYLPRVAFNLDKLFQKAGAHGKQALTMCMGFGCNAAGVVSTRVIDSPRERLIAIITNNFSLCNGRWPTQILIATIFIGALVPAHVAGLISATAVVGVAVLGVAAMLFASWLLSRTMLRGEATTFSLELPPYRPPRILQTLYTSVIDRTLIVLWRAVLFAMPAGAVIWLISNVHLGGASIAEHAVSWLDPVAILVGLNGVILLAYVVAIPANEIVIPTALMLTVLTLSAGGGEGAGVMFELDSVADTGTMLRAAGWTTLTGVSLMLFSLLHNPCSTTIYTIYSETKSAKWTAVATLLPLLMGLVVCFLVAQVWRLVVVSGITP
ncbi:MAG: ferrous iron transport protein B [Gemmatimonadota bacterium]|nr:MAG: ferrous iron transport protein B [Gemmatimonadota bacterium]